MTAPDPRAWAYGLLRRSILKQAKWKALQSALGAVEGRTCLDLGSDNGVMSLLLRDQGGLWHSADLDEDAVACIRFVVGDPVEKLEGPRLPYPDGSFDVVVVVDLLEHIEEDAILAAELARVLKPGGRLVANVPHDRPRSLLRRLRLRLGLTDALHGHVRPGYTEASLKRLLGPHFEEIAVRSYLGPCTELIDIVLTWAMERRGKREGAGKGGLVTPWEGAGDGSRGAYRIAYPFLKAFSLLDLLFAPLPGFMLLACANRSTSETRARS